MTKANISLLPCIPEETEEVAELVLEEKKEYVPFHVCFGVGQLVASSCLLNQLADSALLAFSAIVADVLSRNACSVQCSELREAILASSETFEQVLPALKGNALVEGEEQAGLQAVEEVQVVKEEYWSENVVEADQAS